MISNYEIKKILNGYITTIQHDIYDYTESGSTYFTALDDAIAHVASLVLELKTKSQGVTK